MNERAWSTSTDFDTICRRASGRRRYNALRQLQAELRRFQVARFLRQGIQQVQMAEVLGVHPSTISRDIATLLAEHRLCYSPLPRL
jgi:DNA-binding NarL/FixJ family response regulator